MKTKAHARKIKPSLGTSARPTVQFSKRRRHGFGDSFSYPVLFPSGLSLLTSDDAAAVNKQKKQNRDSHRTPAAPSLHQPTVATGDVGGQAPPVTHSAPGQRRKGLTCHCSPRPPVRLNLRKSGSQDKGLGEMNN